MQLAGASSWVLTTVDAGRLHMALYARDVAGLAVVGGQGEVPGLLGPVAREPAICDGFDRAQLAADWGVLWRELVQAELDVDQSAARESGALPVSFELLDAPRFERLALHPDLGELFRRTYFAADLWFAGREAQLDPCDRDFPYSLILDAAMTTAQECEVDESALAVRVAVLHVEGVWSSPAARGSMLCSDAAARDDVVGPACLRQLFRSSLDR